MHVNILNIESMKSIKNWGDLGGTPSAISPIGATVVNLYKDYRYIVAVILLHILNDFI